MNKLIVILLIYQVLVHAETGMCGDKCHWEFDNEILTISGSGKMNNHERFGKSSGVVEQRNDVKSVIIKEGIESIGDYAFDLFISLEKVEIPSTVKSIGDSAFASCYSLTNIIIPSSVSSIGSQAFTKCTSLKRFIVDEKNEYFSTDENGVLFNKDKTELIQYPIGNEMREYSVPDTVKRVGSFAFHSSKMVVKIILSQELEEIGFWAFVSSESLESVIIPSSIIKIGNNPFLMCSSLKEVIFEGIEEPICGEDTFEYCSIQKVKVYETYQDETFCGKEIERLTNDNSEGTNDYEEVQFCSTESNTCSTNNN